MKAIKQNPYRVIGILVGVNAKEEERCKRRLKQYLEAEQEPEVGDTFPGNAPPERTPEAVLEADSKLNLDKDRMDEALFWFYDGNEVKDKMAFDFMRNDNFEQAKTIWEKMTSSEIAKSNASAFSNLSTLFLSGLLKDGDKTENLFEKGIALKLKFLDSDYAMDLKKIATSVTYKVTPNELQLMFLRRVQDEIEKGQTGIKLDLFLLVVMEQPFSAKEDFLKNFIQKPMNQIESKIKETKSKRKERPANAVEVAKSLINETKESISQLEFVLRSSDIRYTSTVDNIAEEVLECGIEYFNYYANKSDGPATKIDFSKIALDICQKADALAIGNNLKKRIADNVKVMKGVNERRAIDEHIEKLKDLIDKYGQGAQTIDRAKQMISTAKNLLSSFKAAAGNNQELLDIHVNISTRIASDALGMCIEEINKLQENAGNIESLKQKVNEALKIMIQIESMDLLPDFRNKRFKENKDALNNLKTVMEGSGGQSMPKIKSGEQLINVINKYNRYSPTVANAEAYLSEAQPLLATLKKSLGANDETYLGVSTRVAADAQGMCISEINKEQERVSQNNLDKVDFLTWVNSRESFKTLVTDAIKVMATIGKMDLQEDFRKKYMENLIALGDINLQLHPELKSKSTPSYSSSSSSKKKSSRFDKSWWPLIIYVILLAIYGVGLLYMKATGTSSPIWNGFGTFLAVIFWIYMATFWILMIVSWIKK